MAGGEGPKLVNRYEWWYGDLEEFVQKLWGQKWEGNAALGFPGQDTYHDFEVTGGSTYDGVDSNGREVTALWMDEEHTFEEAEAIIQGFKEAGMQREEFAEPGAELLLNWLCREGHIPAGDYRITVWW